MPPADVRLSPHFRLSEFTLSQTAARLRLDNTPSAAQVRNLTRLAQRLEKARAILGALRKPPGLNIPGDVPIGISSGFRAPMVNQAVGGEKASAHLDGLAADFSAPEFGTPREICEALIASDLSFNQIILEGTWVHLAIAGEGKPERRDVRTAVFWPGSKTRYLPGLQ